jgi:L-fucose mutarotase
MLRYPLLHPGILEALAGAGHGSRVLLGDGNYPVATAVQPRAAVVHLNLRPGTVPVEPVLETLITAVAIEAAAVMSPGEGPEPDIFPAFRRHLPGLDLDLLDRSAFYTAARDQDVCLVIATGEQRVFANILLTLGVVQGDLP